MDIGSIIRRSPRLINTSLHILGCIQTLLLAETIQQWRRGELTTYHHLARPIISYISLWLLGYCIIFRNAFNSKSEVTELVADAVTFSDVAKEQLTRCCKNTTILDLFLNVCHACIVFSAAHMDNIFYTPFILVMVVGLFKALKEDIVLWRITNGNTIDMVTAYELFTIQNQDSGVNHDNVYFDVKNAKLNKSSEVRYYLCDELRSLNANLDLVKDLLETFHGYMNIVDRDGLTTPFELACLFCSVDIVQYMVELDDTLLDRRDEKGETPLHWACYNRGFQGLDVVNYILEKRMSLVTVANKNGDLPIHVASISDIFIEEIDPDPVCIEIVWRLLLAYPECLGCVGGTVINSNETDLHSKKNN